MNRIQLLPAKINTVSILLRYMNDRNEQSFHHQGSRSRRLLRRVLPLALRRRRAEIKRRVEDRRRGLRFELARGGVEWPVRIELIQPIMPSVVFEAKVNNLRSGASGIDATLLESGHAWSFWTHVGRPTLQNGFAVGRNIVDGKVKLQVGGGLCQLSSLIYHLALLAGLEVLERHAHSVDIYREEERFTPLGADATVVFGFRDLRLRNPHHFPVSIGCRVEGERLIGTIRSPQPVEMRDVRFEREEPQILGDGTPSIAVRTVIDGEGVVRTLYRRGHNTV